jgi:hypothetical protein
LAAILALVLVVALAEDADARKKRRKKGVADFALVFHHCDPRFTPEGNVPDLAARLAREQCEDTGKDFAPPDRFSCSPGTPFLIPTRAEFDPPNIRPPKPIDGYICKAEGSVKMVSIDGGPPVKQAAEFDLNDVLDRDAPTTERAKEYKIPPGQLASPDLFKCQLIPNLPSTTPSEVEAAGETGVVDVLQVARTTNDFSCEFPENQQTCVFTMHELVPTNVDDVDEHGNVKRDDDGELLEDLDRWDPEDEADSFNDLYLPIACHPVPLAVPAGADAAGEGSALWPFGLVLAAGGAMVGGVMIARRRILQ